MPPQPSVAAPSRDLRFLAIFAALGLLLKLGGDRLIRDLDLARIDFGHREHQHEEAEKHGQKVGETDQPERGSAMAAAAGAKTEVGR